jgi:lipopolysaccharide export system permease protein
VRILSRYVTNGFLSTFALSLLIITFVMSIGGVFKAIDLISRGASGGLILQLFLYGMPPALSFAIPLSLLVASLLVFERLSADGELMAMTACGVSLARLVWRPVLFAVLLLGVCLHINGEWAPRAHYAQRSTVRQLAMRFPMEMLEEGRYIEDIEGFVIYIGRKKGDILSNVRIYDLRAKPRREINARTGRLSLSENGENLLMHLFDVRVDPISDGKSGEGFCAEWTVRIPNQVQKGELKKRRGDRTLDELLKGIRSIEMVHPDMGREDQMAERLTLMVELSRRLVLSFSCLAFVLVGIPLGIKVHRRESSAGIGISLGLALGFHAFIILAESVRRRPELHPEVIPWIPIVLCIGLGLWLIRRQNQPRH